jgi:hypothetical protein
MVYWQRKGSATTCGPPASLLRLQAYYQRFHRYLPRSDYYREGPQNAVAGNASRLLHLDDKQLLAHFNSTYPQAQSWRIWTPPPEILSAVTMSLHRMQCKPASFLLAPPLPMPTGISGLTSACPWPLIPFLQTSKIPSVSSKSWLNDTVLAPLLPAKKTGTISNSGRYHMERWPDVCWSGVHQSPQELQRQH